MNEELKMVAVAYMTAISSNERALGDSILQETFDHDILTDELLEFIEIVGDMTFAIIDSYAEALDFCRDCARSIALESFGQDAAGMPTGHPRFRHDEH